MAVIGIMGGKQHGKDTVAKMVQFYCNPSISRFYSLEEWVNENRPHKFTHNNWNIKKFATPVKEFLSIITGIPVEDFEKESVKESFLPDEWNRWLVDFYANSPSDWADHMSIYLNSVAEVEKAVGYSIGEIMANETPHTAVLERLTVRKGLHLIGTDLFRDRFHPNTWINILFREYIDIRTKDEKSEVFAQTELGEPIYPKWVISDVRFPNEVAAIKSVGGIIIKVVRPEIGIDNSLSSETSLEGFVPDYLIANSGDLNSLYGKVRNIIAEARL